MKDKKLLCLDCRDAKRLRRAYNQYLRYCLNRAKLNEADEALAELKCKKLAKRA